MKKWHFLAVLLFFSLFISSNVKALSIITPDDKTYVDTPYIYIIGKTDDDSITHISVSVNDLKSPLIYVKDPEYVSQFKDFFIIDVELDEGENLVGITTYKDRKVVEEKKLIVYYLKENMKPPKNVTKFHFHKAEKEKLCSECHKVDKETCLECHKSIVSKKYVHGPAGSGDCDVCHNFQEINGIKYIAKADYKELCKECHDSLAPQNFAYAHGPFAVGECVACHNLHSSDFRHQLNSETNELCKGCHVAFKQKDIDHVVSKHPLSGRPDPSRPNKQLDCASCHNPHGEKSSYFFVQGKQSKMEICILCHKK
ncbi:MAG: cytochrome c3 family protein [bacterium]